MTSNRAKLPQRLIAAALLLTAAAGCSPATYRSQTGRELILQEGHAGQTGSVDLTAAKRCLEGDEGIYSPLFGKRHNPCAELGLFLIDNGLADEGIPLLEKGIRSAPSVDASMAKLDIKSMGIMQKTRVANLLFDICLNGTVTDLDSNATITADICAKGGELFEAVGYRNNAIRMYRRQCELSGNCASLDRLDAKPVK